MLLLTENDVHSFIYNNLNDMFIQLNDRYEIVFVNAKFSSTFHVDETQIVGTKIWELFNEKLRIEVDKELKYLNKFKTSSKANYKIRLGKHKSIWQEWNYYAILGDNNKVAKYFIITRDIDEDKSIDALLSFQRDVLHGLSKAETLEQALDIMVEKFSHIGVADSGILYTYNKTDDVFYLKHYINLDEEFLSDKRAYSKIYEEYKDAISDNVKYTEQIGDLKEEGVQSMIRVPLNMDEDRVGIFVLLSHKNMIIQTAVKLVVETLKMQISNVMSKIKINQEYQEEHKRFDTLLKVFPDMIYRYNNSGVITRLDKNGDQSDIPLPEDILSMIKHGFDGFEYDKLHKYNYKMERDGKNRIYEARIVKTDEFHLLISIKNLTHLIGLENELKSVNSKLENILQCGDIGYWELDRERNKAFCNDIFLRILGFSSDDLIYSAEEWESFLHPDDKPKLKHAINDHIINDTVSFEVKARVKTKTGNYKWELFRGKVTKKTPQGKAERLIGVNIDITNIRKVEEKVKEHYNIDSLTHLYNRRFFMEELEKEFKEVETKTEAFSLALLSVDEFEKIKNLYGEDIADFILERFAGFLKKRIRTGDLIGRYNKEKFVLLLKKIKKQNSGEAIKRLQDELKSVEDILGDVDLDITFSAGICDVFDADSDETKEELVARLAVLIDENKEHNENILLM